MTILKTLYISGKIVLIYQLNKVLLRIDHTMIYSKQWESNPGIAGRIYISMKRLGVELRFKIGGILREV